MVAIVVHGGAGTIRNKERRLLSAQGMIQASDEAFKILKNNGNAVDAVTDAVKIMEDLPQFNAGYGSVISSDQGIEMDALVVDGNTGNMGGVIAVSKIKNPILLSRTILIESKHLLFAGSGAEKFAQNNGYNLINPKELITDRVRERFANWLEKQEQDEVDPEGRDKYGTVGAVAIDENGRLAAATSTGGTLGKQPGRVGDTPIFGAGTYADNGIAISATGVGEYIIQGMISMRIKYLAESYDLEVATKQALDEVNRKFGPMGVICLDKNGIWTALKTTPDLAYAFKTETSSGSFLDDNNFE